jgi:hypothetical protein
MTMVAIAMIGSILGMASVAAALAQNLDRARYHDEMSQKYHEAAARPWLTVPHNPRAPKR